MNKMEIKSGDSVSPELLNELQNPSFKKEKDQVGALPPPVIDRGFTRFPSSKTFAFNKDDERKIATAHVPKGYIATFDIEGKFSSSYVPHSGGPNKIPFRLKTENLYDDGVTYHYGEIIRALDNGNLKIFDNDDERNAVPALFSASISSELNYYKDADIVLYLKIFDCLSAYTMSDVSVRLRLIPAEFKKDILDLEA